MNNLENPIIFFGSGRSGTTIISEIVFRHESLAWPSNYQVVVPSVTAINFLRILFDNKLWHLQGQKQQLNQVSAVNKYLFKPAEAYPFWEHITGHKIDFSRGFLLKERASPTDAQKIRSLFSKLVSFQFKERLAFKITGPSRIGYLKSIFPDAIFINIVRDPVPTIQSWLNVDFWQDKGKHQLWWEGAYTEQEIEWAKKNSDHPELLAALQYRKLTDTTNAEIKEHKACCLSVRYEDFVTDPAAIIHQIMDFAELKPSARVDDYLKTLKIFNQNVRTSNEGKSENGKAKSDIMDQILNGNYVYNAG
jgi:hypothetical protein